MGILSCICQCLFIELHPPAKEERRMNHKPFSDITASGHGEIYDVTNTDKFKQFGWRCMTNETGYKSDTLIGNWNEERYDVSHVAKSKPITSQFSHYFETTHNADFKTDKKIGELPEHVRLLGGVATEPRTFPRHQPELDPPSYKNIYNKLESTSMLTYQDPSTMRPAK